jgi:REP element-mobilizing transposase RayT
MNGMRDQFLDPPKRKQNRLRGYDYGRAGYYFITICANERAEFFWEASSMRSVGADIIRPFSPILSLYGCFVEEAIQDISRHYDGVVVDKYVVMPNHVHMILILACRSGRMISAPTKAIPTIVGQMKRAVSKMAGFPIWQKGYHDHIIRSEADYRRIWEYIDTNPAKWREDCYYKEGK